MLYGIQSLVQLLILIIYNSKRSTDGLSAQVFESDIIETEKVYISTLKSIFHTIFHTNIYSKTML